jgi:hypothetical protein
MTEKTIPYIQATPTLEGEDAERFWKEFQKNAEIKVPLTPTPKLEGLRKQLVEEWKQNSRLSLQVKPFFRWYDLWIGFYWDKANRDLYFCLLPTIGFKVSFRRVPRKKT